MTSILRTLLSLLLISTAAVAQTQADATRPPPEAVADLTEDFIPITEDFDGARMTVFGALLSVGSDIVVVIEGPEAKAQIREKVKQMGIWINGDPQEIAPVKSFYAVLSSRPLKEIAPAETLKKLELGLDTLSLDEGVARGLRENREKKGLYFELGDGVKIRDKKLFRADIHLPPNVPVGPYHASIYEINKGTVKASRTSQFKIEQVGLGSTIKTVAQDRAILYAIVSLFLVLAVGGGGAYFFRRVS